MFRFIEKCYFTAMTFLVCSTLKCVSMNNDECKIRSQIVNMNSNDRLFYPYNVKINKCSGGCNNINDPYAKLCVLDDVQNIYVKVYNLMSRTDETRDVKWHETCKCKIRLDAIVCNNKQRWNKDKCRYEFKEFIDKGYAIKDLPKT